MKSYFIIFIALINSICFHAQINNEFDKGKIYNLSGLLTDGNTKDTLYMVIVEFMNKKHEFIKVIQSDFDGIYHTTICSKELGGDTLFIKTTKEFYKQEVLGFNISSDTIFNIDLTFDENRTISKQKFKEYNSKFLQGTECALFQVVVNEIEYLKNTKAYRHYCSGELKKYKSLIDDKVDFSEWTLIEK